MYTRQEIELMSSPQAREKLTIQQMAEVLETEVRRVKVFMKRRGLEYKSKPRNMNYCDGECEFIVKFYKQLGMTETARQLNEVYENNRRPASVYKKAIELGVETKKSAKSKTGPKTKKSTLDDSARQAMRALGFG